MGRLKLKVGSGDVGSFPGSSKFEALPPTYYYCCLHTLPTLPTCYFFRRITLPLCHLLLPTCYKPRARTSYLLLTYFFTPSGRALSDGRFAHDPLPLGRSPRLLVM